MTVAGIDVGGDKKACNLVVLRGNAVVASIAGAAPDDLLDHCLAHNVVAVGIDAPSQWRSSTTARPAERALAQAGISLFSTPARDVAVANTTGFYGWMFNGERVYRALAAAYPLLTARAYSGGRISFETFPHAITAAFLGRHVASARLKLVQRRQVLEHAGIATATLTTIDAVDAALCALAARCLVDGACQAYGDGIDGHIHVPVVDD